MNNKKNNQSKTTKNSKNNNNKKNNNNNNQKKHGKNNDNNNSQNNEKNNYIPNNNDNNNNQNNNNNNNNMYNNNIDFKINSDLYEYVLNNQNIPADLLEDVMIIEDGNCFFRSFSYFFNMTEDNFNTYRSEIPAYAKENVFTNKLGDPNTPTEIKESNNLSLDLKNYVNIISNDGIFAGEIELASAD